MDKIKKRIDSFVKLGQFLDQFSRHEIVKKDRVNFNNLFFDGFKHQLKLAEESNNWFTKDNLLFACENWSETLSEINIQQWIGKEILHPLSDKTVAVIMAGNIPLAGFHDFLSVLISGHAVLAKQSGNDKHLLPFLAKYLEFCNEEFKGKISFTDEKLTGFDAVIATGSTNTARYFEYYFRNKPNIIRKNRNSVAVISGKETVTELESLSNDIFRYFGLGCRSVSKLFVPENYNFDSFFKGIYNKKDIINNIKYTNNYDFNKTVYLMSEFDILENGFLILKEDKSYSSPIASIFYEYYENADDLKKRLHRDKDKIQCIAAAGSIDKEIPFGKTQHPNLWDYADEVNTLHFLSAF